MLRVFRIYLEIIGHKMKTLLPDLYILNGYAVQKRKYQKLGFECLNSKQKDAIEKA